MGNRNNHFSNNRACDMPPLLELLFKAHVLFGDPLNIGARVQGHRLVMPFKAGSRVEGPRIYGEYLPESVGSRIIRSDGTIDFETHFVIRTDDESLVYGQSKGIERIAPNAVQRLSEGFPYDPDEFYVRSFVSFEAADDGPYAWLNRSLCVACSKRTLTGAEATIWELL